MSKRIKVIMISSLLVLVFVYSAFSGDIKGQKILNEGIRYFKAGQYEQAILSFRNIILNSDLEKYHGDAYFWIAKSYIALKKLKEADRNLEYFILNYPNHPYYEEAIYQKGRVLYLENDYENSIQVLESFINQFASSPFVPNAYYWIGEDLYSLGHLEEALKIFKNVVIKYPRSYKVEAARYKISLIGLKKKEQELLKLLKWSHEESLKTVEDFQRRERTYEQAISAYQRRLASFKAAGYEKSIEELKTELEKKNIKIKELKNKITELNTEISTLKQSIEGKGNLSISRAKMEEYEKEKDKLGKMIDLLKAKSEALELKEKILDWLASYKENAR